MQQIRYPDGDLEMSWAGFALAFSRRIPIVLFVNSMEMDPLWSLSLHTFISDFADMFELFLFALAYIHN